ncbi:Aste57867_9679 [Aphanomyces stellatus]|uniref:Aste57867_9679 protein n=1 Tax=Aphanomyces stellatus TaxID=120398 RepID=A0A485KNL0_9STRA|nr:hypothetical protein As57867_009641 [Aphanomyces stellatus]VFT86558.1 Aste57867_9679 [Aphanomyces stellatus]
MQREESDDQLLRQLRASFDAQEHECGRCGEARASIPCVDRCGEAFYCSRECVLDDAKRHRDQCLNTRLSQCGDDDDENDIDEDENENDDDDDNNTDDVDGTDANDVEADQTDDSTVDGSFVDHFSDASMHRQTLSRIQSIKVTCPHCKETAVITRKILSQPETKQQVHILSSSLPKTRNSL